MAHRRLILPDGVEVFEQLSPMDPSGLSWTFRNMSPKLARIVYGKQKWFLEPTEMATVICNSWDSLPAVDLLNNGV